MKENVYYTYIVRCVDNSLYTGITTDIKRRINEHLSQNHLCAKYTKQRKIIKLEALWKSDSRSLASKLEYHIKQLPKQKKEQLINNCCSLELFFDFDITNFYTEDVSSVFILK